VARTTSGGWIVSWQLPEGADGHVFPVSFIEASSDGKPVKRWQDQPGGRREEVYVYALNSPSGFPLVARSGPPKTGATDRGLALIHVEYFPAGNLAPFSQESVSNTCYDNSVIVQMKEQAVAAGIPLGDSGTIAESAQPAIPFSGRQWARLRWPLVMAGAIIVALAGLEVYRRRAG
jgi:hypothetical protein